MNVKFQEPDLQATMGNTPSGWRQEAQLLLVNRASRKHAKDCWNGRGNDNL